MYDLRFCAHYPFTTQAREYAREQNLDLDENAINAAEKRLHDALANGEIKLEASDMESEYKKAIVAYAASRMLLAAMGSRWAQQRAAVAESKRAHEYLKTRDSNTDYAEKLAESLNIHFVQMQKADSHDEQEYLIPFWEYLKHAPKDVHYKLSRAKLQKGMVKISQSQRLRIIEEAIRKRLEEPIPQVKEIPPILKPAIARLSALVPSVSLAPIKIDRKDFPPCINKLIDDLQMSVNVPHMGRVALAIYLIKAGLSDEQIAKVFSNAPDYNAQTTNYQIAYVRKKAYSMPSCATMDSWGLCIAICKCKNPIYFREQLHGNNARKSMAEGNFGLMEEKKDSEGKKDEQKAK
jgi:DNA primase large subunit